MKYVYYINVGDLPKAKAKEYVDTIIATCSDDKHNVLPLHSTIFVPIRDGDGYTRIEALPE